ncbi:MAG TPA: hypothetical protein VF092_00890 [Longimicrobium sp.]
MASTIAHAASKLREPLPAQVLHFLTLRRAIGFIGIALPFVLVAGENLRDALALHATPARRELIELSISAYFHTGMRDVFVGSLFAVGIFLICYNGYQRIDNLLANLAGFAALLVALFPTWEASREATDTGIPAPDSVTLFSGPNAPDPTLVGYIHFGAATMFFVILAVMSIFLFTKSEPHPTPEKKQRNRVYVACGVIIVLCLVLIAAGKLFLGDDVERATSFVFWGEAVAIVAFGVSWLVKGEAILKDALPQRAPQPA